MRKLRGLSAHKSYGLLAVLTLTLAVGANLLVFTIVNALWLRPRPVANPDRVVVISNLSVAAELLRVDEPIDLIKAPVLEDARHLPVFEGVAGQVASGGLMGDFRPRVVISRIGHPVETLGVTSQYFSVLGVGLRGRDFTAEDDRLGAAGVAIISDRLWKSGFGGTADVIGTRVETSHVPLQIVGIAPAGFFGARLGEQTDLWIPRYLVPQVSNIALGGSLALASPDGLDHSLPLFGLARLRAGVTAADAERAIAQPNARLIVRPLKDVFGTPDRPTIVMREQVVIWIVAVTASLVLLAGCTTLMAIVLVHYERRRQELAVRLTLGATRARLISQLGIELLALGAAGLAGAFVVTAWAVRILPALSLPGGVDLGRLDLSIDWRVAMVGTLAALGALSAAAAVPILRFSRANLVMGLISPTTTGAPSSLRLRRIMLGLHVAATIVVLVAAGLFVRTVAYGFGRGPGFDVDRTAFVQLQPSFFGTGAGLDEKGVGALHVAALARLLEGLRASPGIEIVAIAGSPLQPDVPPFSKTRTVTADAVKHEMAVLTSSYPPGYLEALGARVIAGRTLQSADITTAGVRPAVVTATFAESLWPNSVAVGRQFSIASRSQDQPYQIVGIVADIVCLSLRSEPCATVFVAANERAANAQVTFGTTLTIRTRGDAAVLVEPVRRLASQIFPNAQRLNVRTGRDLVALDLGQERLGLWFFSGFGLVVLALGLGGVFGLVAYLAESKRRELGLRMALGATHATLRRRIVLTGLWPVVSGTAAGLIAAVFLAKTLDTLLVGISHLDPPSYAGAAVIMIGGSIAGGLAAAWRIHRLSPLEALRAE